MIELLLFCVALLFGLGLTFFFAGSETAIITANRYRLRGLHEQGDPIAGRVLHLLASTQRLLVMVLIANNFMNVLITMFFERFLAALVPHIEKKTFYGVEMSVVLGILVLTPIMVIFAEIFPKALFRARADQWIVPLRPVLAVMLFVFKLPIVFIEWFSFVMLSVIGSDKNRSHRRLTRQDVITLITPQDRTAAELEPEEEAETETAPETPAAAGMAEATVESEPAIDAETRPEEKSDERKMIQNIIELHATRAYEIMTPLVELVAVRLGAVDIAGFKALARSSGYSRLPAYHERIVNLEGTIDIYRVLRDDDGTKKLEDFLEKAFYVPESKRVDDLLQEFLRLRLKNAIVVDEYGGCAGLITREDILEEVVGELQDELDEPINELFETSDGSFLAHGRAEIDHINETLGTDFPEDDWETLAGLIMHEMGRVPAEGDEVVVHGWRVRVVRMIGLRIVHVLLTRL